MSLRQLLRGLWYLLRVLYTHGVTSEISGGPRTLIDASLCNLAAKKHLQKYWAWPNKLVIALMIYSSCIHVLLFIVGILVLH